MKRVNIIFCIFILITCIYTAHASEPFDILKEKVNRVFSVLNDPAYSDQAKKTEQHDILYSIIEEAFDFNGMARLTLARNWQAFTPVQQEEFAGLFGQFLGNTYLDKIQSGFSDEQVEYTGEELLSNTKAVVMTNLIRKGVKTPVYYSLQKQGTIWRIYDVKIEGVSLLKNYRTQFSEILLKERPEGLIAMLKEKLK
ncbi:MAG: ABC transporter substrate-binding protein [Deltaproteobacteria bacterium]|nr:ABC transporter substrate-binding protein [Deltaproteobacteria bacterium]